MASPRRLIGVGFSNLEKELLRKGYRFAGVDEAGRGPLAGPVVAAAVIWNYKEVPEYINDSKLLHNKLRRELFDYILTKAVAVSVGWVTPSEIDRINILNASLLAMARAASSLETKPQMLLIDGNRRIPFTKIPQKTIIGGDGKHLAISAASIVAKVSRDNLMTYFDTHYPGYGFSQNSGYPTRKHKEAIRTLGPCPIHRKTFSGVKELCT